MKSLLLCLILLFVLAASESTPPGKPVTWDTLCVPENNDQQVAIEGYPYLPVTALVSDTMLIDLHEEPDREGRLISTSMTLGSGNNQMVEPPDDYTAADLLIRAGDGTEIRTGQRIKVEGELIYSADSCIIFAATAIVAVGGS